MNRRAFTLIELLVVIAIIAILAAILFPVFAQAKAAAKKTVALSNTKQQALTAIMYGSDSDDLVPLNAEYHTDGSNYQWQDKVQPYAKNYGIVLDPISNNQNLNNGIDYVLNFGMLPVAAAIKDGSFPYFLTRTAAWYQTYTRAALKYDGLSGYGQDADAGAYYSYNPKGASSKSFTSVARPAEMVLTFTSNNWDGWHGIYGQQDGFGWCGGWASGQGFNADYGFFGFQPRHSGGQNTCDVATRQANYGKGTAIVSFSDGHAKGMKSGELVKANAADDFLYYWWPNA